MSTQALDVVTIFHALNELERVFLGPARAWRTEGYDQGVVFDLYRRCKSFLGELEGLRAKASVDWQELNEFLTANGFAAMFDRPLDGIGVVSILDMLVEWLAKAALCEIRGRDGLNYTGFEIPEAGRDVYRVEGLDGKLARLRTKTGDSIWLTMLDVAPSGLIDLVCIPFEVMAKTFEPDRMTTTVQVPELSFDLAPDISFLQGVNTRDTLGQYWYIYQAKQQFKLRIDRTGAHVKVATGIGMRKGVSLGDEPEPLIYDRPFIGWFTQKGATELPIAVFYADYDCWRTASRLRG